MLISAHAGYPQSLDSGAEFIEIDVRRNSHAAIIDSHDEPKAGANHAMLYEILEAMARRGIGLHLDTKEAGYEIELLTRTLDRLPADKVVATPDFDRDPAQERSILMSLSQQNAPSSGVQRRMNGGVVFVTR